MESESFEALQSGFKKLSVSVPLYRIVRDDLQEDKITKLQFSCYDSAYDELERFYGDLCCSDERIEYSIVSIWLWFWWVETQYAITMICCWVVLDASEFISCCIRHQLTGYSLVRNPCSLALFPSMASHNVVTILSESIPTHCW